MGDSGQGSPAMPAMRSKVEMIKDVKTGKGVVLAVGDVAQLVERCEVKEGDKEPRFLLKQKVLHHRVHEGPRRVGCLLYTSDAADE